MRNSRGFTLVELLVVIAIIGVLIALLLPAVQQAREAARRMQCSNHIKQLGLAVHNYHDTFGKLPYNRSPQTGSGSSRGRGASWFVRLLPFLEQSAAYDQLEFTGDFTHQDAPNVNTDVLSRFAVEGLYCPSSPLPRFATWDKHGVAYEAQRANYVGIEGSYFKGGTVSTVSTDVNHSYYGNIYYNGTIVGIWSGQSAIGFSALTDGTSNTMFVSEQSNYQFNGTTQVDRAVSNYWGGAWAAGACGGSSPGNWVQNGTSLRWPIGTYGGTGNDRDFSQNSALTSAHPGGVMGGMGDGSVRFLSETVNFAVLTALCDRQDGSVVGEY